MGEPLLAESLRSLTIFSGKNIKAWFPYDRNDRSRNDHCDRCERSYTTLAIVAIVATVAIVAIIWKPLLRSLRLRPLRSLRSYVIIWKPGLIWRLMLNRSQTFNGGAKTDPIFVVVLFVCAWKPIPTSVRLDHSWFVFKSVCFRAHMQSGRTRNAVPK